MNPNSLVVSTLERECIEEALRQDLRMDGRRPFDLRRLVIKFFKEDGTVEVQQGQTRILAVASGQLAVPYADRPNEGIFSVQTEFSLMADPSFEPGRPAESAVELGRIIDRGLRASRAVDTESLCILAGKAVWALRLDLHILDNCGNLIDAANVAALLAMLSYRRPECTVGGENGDDITVHPPEVKEPIPLILHHLPIALSFAFFDKGDLVVLDPTLKEEAVMGSRLTISVNAHGELCAVQKGGGLGVTISEIMRCLRIACAKAAEITTTLRKAVESHELERAQSKVKRHKILKGVTADVKSVLTHSDLEVLKTEINEFKMDISEDGSDNDGKSSDSNSDNVGETAKCNKPTEENDFLGCTSSQLPEAANFGDDFPPDADAMEELKMVTKVLTKDSGRVETKSIVVSGADTLTAAAVYAKLSMSQKQASRQMGPVFPKEQNVDDALMVEALDTKPSNPTSLLDAVKKKNKRKKSGVSR